MVFFTSSATNNDNSSDTFLCFDNHKYSSMLLAVRHNVGNTLTRYIYLTSIWPFSTPGCCWRSGNNDGARTRTGTGAGRIERFFYALQTAVTLCIKIQMCSFHEGSYMGPYQFREGGGSTFTGYVPWIFVQSLLLYARLRVTPP